MKVAGWKPQGLLSSFFLFLLVITGGCAVHRVDEQLEPPTTLPESYNDKGTVTPPDKWWLSFEEPQLNQLMDQLLQQNLDLRSAWARLRQTEALAVQANASRLPEVTGTGVSSRNKQIFNGLEQTTNNFSLKAAANYEVDIWKKLSSTRRAAALDVLATRDDAEALAQTLTASLAKTWFAIIEQRETLALLEEQLEVSRDFLKVVETRFGQAQSSAVAVFQQRQNLSSIEAQIPTAEAQLHVLEHQLAVLLGKAPREASAGDRADLPQLPDYPELGIPLALLEQRPDIRAARSRINAADHRVGVAIANRYPSLRLTLDGGFQASDIDDLFSNFVWGLTSNLTGPIFDAGNRKAEVDRRRAVLETALNDYEKVILEAVREVEDASIRENKQREFLDRLDEQQKWSERALEAARSRYLRGVGDYLTVLTELSSLQRIQRTHINARRTLLDFRIDLYKAIGGKWSTDLTPSEPRTAIAGAE